MEWQAFALLLFPLSINWKWIRSMCLPHRGEQTRTVRVAAFFQHAECIHICQHAAALTHFHHSAPLNYAYRGVVWGIKNALDCHAIMIAEPVVNNAYLTESNTDYCKCIIAFQSPKTLPEVRRWRWKLKSNQNHMTRCPLSISKQDMNTGETQISRCDSTVALVILMGCVIFTKHPSSLKPLLDTYIRLCLSLAPPRLSKIFPQGQSLASSELATSNIASLTCPSKKTLWESPKLCWNKDTAKWG